MATQDPSRKVRNIKRNNNVTVLIDTTDVRLKRALVYGTAELDYEDVISKRATIFERRLSKEQAETYARRLSDKSKCVIVRITCSTCRFRCMRQTGRGKKVGRMAWCEQHNRPV
jgi:general stress protein 26